MECELQLSRWRNSLHTTVGLQLNVFDLGRAMQPHRDSKVTTWNPRNPPNQRSCFLFRIDGYEKLSASRPKQQGFGIASPRLVFLLNAIGHRFHTWRATSLNEVDLLVFDRQFDFSNLASSRPGADPVFILRCALSESNAARGGSGSKSDMNLDEFVSKRCTARQTLCTEFVPVAGGCLDRR